MLNNLLKVSAELAEKGYPKDVGIGETALYALLGFAVVFLGISFLILVVWVVGKIMSKVSSRTRKTKVNEVVESVPAPVQDEETDEETVAVITAAIMAYYVKENKKCEFTVKRIKRL